MAHEAKKLAEIYNISQDKAYLAGLLHDCAKNCEEKYIKTFDISLTIYPVSSINDPTLHSFLGAEVAKRVYNIDDDEVLNAISFHTTGKKNMDTLAKIIFIADAIEPGRSYPKVDVFRELSKKNLNDCMLGLLDNSICFLISKESFINPLTLEARNYFIEVKHGKIRYNR